MSQTNGIAEEAGKTIRDMARVLKVQLEMRTERMIEMKEPIMKWLVRWSAMCLSSIERGNDNKTTYERQTIRSCNVEVLPFGERTWFRY